MREIRTKPDFDAMLKGCSRRDEQATAKLCNFERERERSGFLRGLMRTVAPIMAATYLAVSPFVPYAMATSPPVNFNMGNQEYTISTNFEATVPGEHEYMLIVPGGKLWINISIVSADGKKYQLNDQSSGKILRTSEGKRAFLELIREENGGFDIGSGGTYMISKNTDTGEINVFKISRVDRKKYLLDDKKIDEIINEIAIARDAGFIDKYGAVIEFGIIAIILASVPPVLSGRLAEKLNRNS